jgi:hypothetical protein
MLDGDPSHGKSLITLDIAARVSRGGVMPLCKAPESDPIGVLIIAAEDAVEQVIKPRCVTAGCDEQLVRVSETIRIGKDERPIRFPDDFDLLKREIIDFKIGFVIVDPLLGFLSQAVDSHKDQSIRDVLHQLKLVADTTGAAVVGLRHLSKSGVGGNALYRGLGSIGITAAARSALVVDSHPTEEGVRVLATTKCNIVRMPRSITYRINEMAGQPVIKWGEECDITAADLGVRAQNGGNRAQAEAMEFLSDLLKNGRRSVSEVKKLAINLGITDRTLERAKKALKVRSCRMGFSPASWEWELPTDNIEGRQPIAE